jgi:hypothetical protein
MRRGRAMTEERDPFYLSLSPNVRLRMTVGEEMELDPEEQIFNDALHDKYIRMHGEAHHQQNGALRTLIIADSGLALLLFGKDIQLPWAGLTLLDLPAANEVLTVIASYGFLTLSMAFLNAQMYVAILDQFYIRRASRLGIDPDFISFGNILSQIYLKTFSSQMSRIGRDFFEANAAFKRFYGLLTLLLAAAWFSVIPLHLFVVGAGVWHSIGPHWAWWPFAGAIALVHTAAITLNLSPSFPFLVPADKTAVIRSRRPEGNG